MNGILVGIMSIYISAFPSAMAALPQQILCADAGKRVVLHITPSAKGNSIEKLLISNEGKNRSVKKTDVLRFSRTEREFIVIFRVETRLGPHELELNTKFVNHPKIKRRFSSGSLINRTSNDKLEVSCQF